MDTLIQSVLECVLRNEAPPLRALEVVGESDPALAADALLAAASLPELAASRSSWVPALMVSPQPGRGALLLTELARNYYAATQHRLDPARMRSLALVVGSSELMGQLLLANPEWADDLEGDPPAPPDLSGSALSWGAIREAKFRGLLVAVARELLGCPLQVALAEFSGLADACLETAVECASAETGIEAPALFALGQLGGSEIGISPEVDLLMVDRDSENNFRTGCDRAAELERFVGCFKSNLEQTEPFGPMYRFDLGDRPYGLIAGQVSEARDRLRSPCSGIERQRLLRVRGIAGPGDVIEAFLGRFTSGAAKSQMALIAEESARDSRNWHGASSSADLVTGAGGIREVEAIVYMHWARVADAAIGSWGQRTILDGLYELRECGFLEEESGARLADAYSWLRRAEHSLQLVGTQSPREFPDHPGGQIALARCMGYREPEARVARDRLLRDRQEVLEEVELQFDSARLACFVAEPIESV